MKKIVMYTNKTCPYCKQIKTFLEENNIKFTEKLTEEFTDEWNMVVDLVGMPVVPNISFEGNYFIPGRDFNSPQQVLEIINNFKPSAFDSQQKILEKLKTLTYSIHMAFGRTDNILRNIESQQVKQDETNKEK